MYKIKTLHDYDDDKQGKLRKLILLDITCQKQITKLSAFKFVICLFFWVDRTNFPTNIKVLTRSFEFICNSLQTINRSCYLDRLTQNYALNL